MVGLPKYTGPLAPVPSYLDPAAEVTAPGVKMSAEEFVPWCTDMFVAAGAPLLRAFELTACKILETGWGAAFRAFNLGGVKATPNWAKAYKARTGKSAPFYRAHGNKGTGDSQTVIYRGYLSAADFAAEWMATFVPKPGTVGAAHRYKRTGELFWSGGDWFAEMLRVGYRGPVTAKKPAGSIKDQVTLTKAARTRWAQRRLGVIADGKWGPRSKAACEAFQQARGLKVSAQPDDATCLALAGAAGT